jgi:predicted dehydrogenase
MNPDINKKEIRLAFIGCGAITAKHSKTINSFDQKVKKYYASRDKQKAYEYSAKFNGSGSFGSYGDAFKSPEIDSVLIATPPNSHLELTLKALEAGKHVIVEKPPFLKSINFEKIRRAKEKNNRLVMVAENYYYKPVAKEIRKLLQSNVVGDILIVHANALKYQELDDWRNESNISGGGALLEGGIHWINFMANLGLKVRNVRGFQPKPKAALERSMMVVLEYEEGAVGSLYYSWEVPSLFKGLRISKIFGREGSITFESNGLFIVVRGKQKKIIFPGLKDISGFKGMFIDFFNAIRTGKEPEFNFDLAKRDIQIIEAAYQTASEKSNGGN